MHAWLLASLLGAIGGGGHAANATFRGVVEQGLQAGGVTVKLPETRLAGAAPADAERAALREVAGSDRGVENFVRDSVTAPHVLRATDVRADGATIRVVDVYFVVHADLADIDAREAARRAGGEEVEAGNMRFRADLLDDAEANPGADGGDAWRVRLAGTLLDRLQVEVTNRVELSREEGSIVVASRTMPGEANRWAPIPRPAGEEPRPYAGGVSYAAIRRLQTVPGALFVEVHAAFVEPDPWFRGAPILRSKFSVVAQDQIRRLRRQVLEDRAPSP